MTIANERMPYVLHTVLVQEHARRTPISDLWQNDWIEWTRLQNTRRKPLRGRTWRAPPQDGCDSLMGERLLKGWGEAARYMDLTKLERVRE